MSLLLYTPLAPVCYVPVTVIEYLYYSCKLFLCLISHLGLWSFMLYAVPHMPCNNQTPTLKSLNLFQNITPDTLQLDIILV